MYARGAVRAFQMHRLRLPQVADAFLPHVDNWATCDTLIPKLFDKRREELYPQVVRWIRSDVQYARRFAGLTMERRADELQELRALCRSDRRKGF